MTIKNDQLPERMTTLAIESGASKGEISHVPEMLPEYYKPRTGNEMGVPAEEQPQELQVA